MYLLDFTDAFDIVAKILSKKDAKQLRMHDNYNLDAKKLAGIMVQGLRDWADLQEEKWKFNEWAEDVGADNDDAKGQVDNGDGATET